MGTGWSIQNSQYSEVFYTGKAAYQIAKESGVTFGKGTLKKIQPFRRNDGFGCLANPDDVNFTAFLTDGTEINYRRQMPTNKAKITKTENRVIFSGIQDMYVYGTDKVDNYSVFGCKGFVNVKGGQGKDVVKTNNRTMSDGSVQTSYVFICHDDNDIVNKTKNDSRYKGN